jgi:FAD/FMN-containing dehydrogenase
VGATVAGAAPAKRVVGGAAPDRPVATARAEPVVVNDVTGLDRTVVEAVVEPTSVAEVQRIVRTHRGPISIGGGRYSMGGQIAAPGALFIDMRKMDKVVALSPADRTITVEAGITWRKIQETIDPHDLSLRIMQSYANFTVGGSLSVNVHGRYVNHGPLVYAVRSIAIVLADGSLVEASARPGDLFGGGTAGSASSSTRRSSRAAPEGRAERHAHADRGVRVSSRRTSPGRRAPSSTTPASTARLTTSSKRSPTRRRTARRRPPIACSPAVRTASSIA